MLAGAPRGWTQISMASCTHASCRYDVVVIGAGASRQLGREGRRGRPAELGGSLGYLVALAGLFYGPQRGLGGRGVTPDTCRSREGSTSFIIQTRLVRLGAA